MDKQPDPETIADEAVGLSRGTERPEFVQDREKIAPEEIAQRNAMAPGPQASTAEKSAASLGERSSEAYANTGDQQSPNPAITGTANPEVQSGSADRILSAGKQLARGVSDQIADQRFSAVITAFALGYIAALLLHGRRS